MEEFSQPTALLSVPRAQVMVFVQKQQACFLAGQLSEERRVRREVSHPLTEESDPPEDDNVENRS